MVITDTRWLVSGDTYAGFTMENHENGECATLFAARKRSAVRMYGAQTQPLEHGALELLVSGASEATTGGPGPG